MAKKAQKTPKNGNLREKRASPAKAREAREPKSVLFLCQIRVDLLNQLVSVGAVNVASVCDGLAARCRATQAVHTDLKEEGSGIGSFVQTVAISCIATLRDRVSSSFSTYLSISGMCFCVFPAKDLRLLAI